MTAHIIINQGRVGDRAPHMIRGAQLTGRELATRHGLEVSVVGTPSPAQDDDWTVSLPAARDTLVELAHALKARLAEGATPVILSSTCSASLATLPVVLEHNPDTVVLYIDGHGDFNTPDTTDTGYLGGMVLSGACGLWDSGHGDGLDPRQAILVGSRDIDEHERALIARHGVRHLTTATATADNLRREIGASPVWVHVDWDVLDPGHIPADYVVPNGLTPEQMTSLFAAISPEQLVGVELAEFNAPDDPVVTDDALKILTRIVSPLLTTSTS
jgi:arginase family enzyme